MSGGERRNFPRGVKMKAEMEISTAFAESPKDKIFYSNFKIKIPKANVVHRKKIFIKTVNVNFTDSDMLEKVFTFFVGPGMFSMFYRNFYFQ